MPGCPANTKFLFFIMDLSSIQLHRFADKLHRSGGVRSTVNAWLKWYTENQVCVAQGKCTKTTRRKQQQKQKAL